MTDIDELIRQVIAEAREEARRTPEWVTAQPLPEPWPVRPWDGTKPDMDRYLDDRQAQARRVDEESLILGLSWSEAVCTTHEATSPWAYATSDRTYRAWPERRQR